MKDEAVKLRKSNARIEIIHGLCALGLASETLQEKQKVGKAVAALVGFWRKGKQLGKITCLLILLCGSAAAHEIDLARVAQIESSGGKFLVGDHGAAIGRYQIQQGLLSDYNRVEKQSLRHPDMFDDQLSKQVADWAFGKYFPLILKRMKKPATTENLLVCWNAGCGALKRKQLPKVTRHYLIKYNQLNKEQRA